MIEGFREFEFDLTSALLGRLVKCFEETAPTALTEARVQEIPDAQGVYQLLLDDRIVYIGKTDAEQGLPKRLERHARTILHRKNLDPHLVRFKAIRVFVFTAIDLETQLIKHYSDPEPPAWNNSGFGSNDPGRARDTTKVNPEGFDALYPINIDREIDVVLGSVARASEFLEKLKEELPYYFRFETAKGSRRPHPELVSAPFEHPKAPFTVRSALVLVLRRLPKGWQATALPGRVLLYREERDYEYGAVIGRS